MSAEDFNKNVIVSVESGVRESAVYSDNELLKKMQEEPSLLVNALTELSSEDLEMIVYELNNEGEPLSVFLTFDGDINSLLNKLKDLSEITTLEEKKIKVKTIVESVLK